MIAVRVVWALFTTTFALIGGVFGYAMSVEYLQWSPVHQLLAGAEGLQRLSTVAFVLLGALVGFIFAAFFYRKVVTLAADLQQLSFADKVAGVLGVLLGLGVSGLIAFQFAPLIQGKMPYFRATLPFMIVIVCVYLGVSLTISMKEELANALVPRSPETAVVEEKPPGPLPKFLDTNVIIDGRMADLCKTGFLEGPIYIPQFVLDELQLIADSEDSLRRARGRRGLDILGRMQKDTDLIVEVYDEYDREVERIPQVDAKLVRLAREQSGAIVTNDYNLNKVAELHRVPVLNINELANALKPVVLPGEDLRVTIVKEGKENRQGVAYLEDGTMVVVEGAVAHIGKTLSVLVTSVLQTVAGKMIFAELPAQQPRPPAPPPPPARSESKNKPMAKAGDDLFANDNRGGAGSRSRRPSRRPRQR